MKTILALFAALSFGAFLPASAEAREPSRGSSRLASTCGCGAPVYQVRVLVGYERDGCPIYRWKTVGHTCRPRHDHGGHGHGHDHGDRDRGGHDHGRGDSGRGHGHRR